MLRPLLPPPGSVDACSDFGLTDSTRLLQTQRHFLITSVVLVGTFVIGNVIPFFKDLQVSASVGPRRLPSS